jgi:hypothetical protein
LISGWTSVEINNDKFGTVIAIILKAEQKFGGGMSL